MNPLRLAVIGTGALGRHHARILSGMPDVALVAVSDLNSAAGREVAEKHNTRYVAEYRELLGEVDAAVVATPTCAHLPVARDFLQRRIPVLVEKPVASSLAEAEELAFLAGEHETLLQVGHVERFNPAFAAACESIGDPRYIRAERYSPFAFRSTDISVVHDVMIHDLDLVLSLVPAEVVRVEAFGINLLGQLEDCVQARLTFSNGCIADVSANRVSPVQKRAMQVWSAAGCTAIDFASREVMHFSRGEMLETGPSPVELARRPGAVIDELKARVFGEFLRVDRPAVAAGDALTAELASFIECVRTRTEPVVGPPEALAVMTVADDILRCVAAHQWDGQAAGRIGPALAPAFARRRAG